ncbi:dihydrolipoyl dehydrogenase [Candidatus Woesearchaeota archaeon]|nr:dihydrolipoyl dehydrogenase [Candidatus Woesearchaeota archaeon]
MTDYGKVEVVVVGAGPGGYVAAIRAAQLGKKVALIEKDRPGGICLNYGCIPSKAMIHAADFLDKLKDASKLGINVENVSLDFAKMQEWKDGVVSKLTNGVSMLCKANNVELIKGTATFESSNKLRIDNDEVVSSLEFDKAVIATGSNPIEIPSMKFDEQTILSSTGALYLENIPQNFVVVGGGYIGLELGTVYAKLGSKVTVVEMADQVLPGFEKDTVAVVAKNLKKMNVETFTGAKAESFSENKLGIDSKEKGKVTLDADAILVAVGRTPNTHNLKLENTKVQLNEKGFVKVNDALQTDDEGIYAIGDISVGPMLAHKASHQGKAVAEIISGTRQDCKGIVVPSVIFTDPEIASVGLTEKEAKDQGMNIKIGKFPFTALGKAIANNETEGFVKMISEESGKVIGVEIVGHNASDLISEAALAIKKNATVEDISETIHPHPTMSESLMEAAEATMGKAIHILNPK